uniref:Prn-P n=1 Tax=Mus musculus TaxID=10090 RepID=Q9Z190_MOUSE|nr:unnamed protein product [Mus musculus]
MIFIVAERRQGVLTLGAV